jgi:hypothetical protein
LIPTNEDKNQNFLAFSRLITFTFINKLISHLKTRNRHSRCRRQPFLVLAGNWQVHFSVENMRPFSSKLANFQHRTHAVYWELIEPTEGKLISLWSTADPGRAKKLASLMVCVLKNQQHVGYALAWVTNQRRFLLQDRKKRNELSPSKQGKRRR